MKAVHSKLLVVGLSLGLTVAASSAQAVTVTCADAGIVNHGYSVTIESGRRAAQVQQHNTQGIQLLADEMPCVREEIDPLMLRGGDVVLKCRKESSVDHGLVLHVRSPDANGLIRATLLNQTFAGPKLVSEMRCVPAITDEVTAEEAVLP